MLTAVHGTCSPACLYQSGIHSFLFFQLPTITIVICTAPLVYSLVGFVKSSRCAGWYQQGQAHCLLNSLLSCLSLVKNSTCIPSQNLCNRGKRGFLDAMCVGIDGKLFKDLYICFIRVPLWSVFVSLCAIRISLQWRRMTWCMKAKQCIAGCWCSKGRMEYTAKGVALTAVRWSIPFCNAVAPNNTGILLSPGSRRNHGRSFLSLQWLTMRPKHSIC